MRCGAIPSVRGCYRVNLGKLHEMVMDSLLEGTLVKRSLTQVPEGGEIPGTYLAATR